MENIPQHIGFIMDGNGRWAKKRVMPRNFGHNQDIRASADENIRIIILGDIMTFDKDIQDELIDIMQTSKNNTGFIVGIALNYGGRAEICNAARTLAVKCSQKEITPTKLPRSLSANICIQSKIRRLIW